MSEDEPAGVPFYPWYFDPQEDGIWVLTEVDPGIKRFLPYTDDPVLADLDLGISREDAQAALDGQTL